MSEHPIQGLMSTAMESIKDMVDVNTIVGDAVTAPDGTLVIPISRVSFGFAAGGSEFAPKNEKGAEGLFGGGSGAGISIMPVAFMVVGNDQIKLLPVSRSTNTLDKLVDYVPEVINKIMGAIKHKTKPDKTTIVYDVKTSDTSDDE